MTGFAILDFETTGLFPARGDRVVEVGVVVLDIECRTEKEWSTLIHPGKAVAATHVHRLTNEDLRGAPTFGDVVDQINEFLRGRILVGHNVSFDLDFLALEYSRSGWEVPSPPWFCTLEASSSYLPSLSRRKLAACCSAAGIAMGNAHAALDDARATAALLAHYRDRRRTDFDSRTVPELKRAADIVWPSIPLKGTVRILERSRLATLREHISAERGSLSRLLEQLPSSPQQHDASPHLMGYRELLLQALEDGILTPREQTDLETLATAHSLKREEVEACHREILSELARRVVADGRVTRDERTQLKEMATTLGLDLDIISEALAEAKDHVAKERAHHCSPLPSDWSYGDPLRVGDGVVFTGCDDLERARLEGLAQASGLRVTGGVSRKTAVLVTDDPTSGTTKARKAEELGTRIVRPEVFAKMVAHVQPAIDA